MKQPGWFFVVGVGFFGVSLAMLFSFFGDIIGGEYIFLYPILLLGVIGVLLLIGAVKTLLKMRGERYILENGLDGTGKFLRMEEKLVVGGGAAGNYRIVFSFENMGKTFEMTSAANFSKSEAEALAAKGAFPIRYLDNKAVIVPGF